MSAAGEAFRSRAAALPLPVRQLLTALPFLAPSIVLFGTFVFYPLGKSIYLGFFISNPFGTKQIFVGLDQYQNVLTSSAFISSLLVTATFALYTVVPSIVIGTFLAVLANQKLPGISIFRTIFSSTLAASVGIASVIWFVLLHPSGNVLNEYVITKVGFDEVRWFQDGGWAVSEHSNVFGMVGAWFADPNWALIAVSLVTIWMNIGLFTVIVLAGLQTIPDELYESARIDGAGRWSEFWHVTLPMLSPTLFFASVIGVIFAYQAFGQFDVLTGGGPVDATNVQLYSIYEDGFENFRTGAASVEALGLFFILLGLTFLQFRFLSRRVHYR